MLFVLFLFYFIYIRIYIGYFSWLRFILGFMQYIILIGDKIENHYQLELYFFTNPLAISSNYHYITLFFGSQLWSLHALLYVLYKTGSTVRKQDMFPIVGKKL